MKLYTEEQAKYFFECGRNYQNNAEITFRIAKEEIPTPVIELPSDEEIGQGCDDNIPLDEKDMWSERFYFRVGAKWMKEQILKQDKQ
jgi:hypothetical protein